MNPKQHSVRLIFVAATCVFAPLQVSALSVNDFEKQGAQQQADSYTAVAKEAILDAYKANNQVGKAVEDYFTKVPPGASETKGYTAFDAVLQNELKNNKNNPTDLDKIQIEDIVAYVIKTDILPNIPIPPSPNSP